MLRNQNDAIQFAKARLLMAEQEVQNAIKALEPYNHDNCVAKLTLEDLERVKISMSKVRWNFEPPK